MELQGHEEKSGTRHARGLHTRKRKTPRRHAEDSSVGEKQDLGQMAKLDRSDIALIVFLWAIAFGILSVWGLMLYQQYEYFYQVKGEFVCRVKEIEKRPSQIYITADIDGFEVISFETISSDSRANDILQQYWQPIGRNATCIQHEVGWLVAWSEYSRPDLPTAVLWVLFALWVPTTLAGGWLLVWYTRAEVKSAREQEQQSAEQDQQ